MARREKTVTATIGRDAGKVFKIVEMGARQGEDWAMRAILAMGKTNKQNLDAADLALATASGMEGFALLATDAWRAFMAMAIEDAKPLMDEMMSCVVFLPDPANPMIENRDLDTQIEEVQTRLILRDEVVALHLGFSLRERFRTWGASLKAMIQASSNTAASPEPSEAS